MKSWIRIRLPNCFDVRLDANHDLRMYCWGRIFRMLFKGSVARKQRLGTTALKKFFPPRTITMLYLEQFQKTIKSLIIFATSFILTPL